MAQNQTTSQQLSNASYKLKRDIEDAIAAYAKERRAESIRAGRKALRRRRNRSATTTVAYIRLASSAAPDIQRAMVAQQQATCEQYAHRLGTRISIVYVDIGVSGAAESRPLLDRLFGEIASRRIGQVVIATPNVLSRNNQLRERLLRRFHQHGVSVTMPCDYKVAACIEGRRP